MINVVVINIVRFVALILFQVLILNNANLTALNINPFVYVLFILLLPFEIPGWLILLLAFFTGITLDIFTDDIGIHAFSLVLTAFSRPIILGVLSSREGYKKRSLPNMQDNGFVWFLKYAFFAILIHNFSYYFVETFQLKYFFVTLLKVILNTIFTTIIIILIQSFASSSSRRKD